MKQPVYVVRQHHRIDFNHGAGSHFSGLVTYYYIPEEKETQNIFQEDP